MIAVETQKIAGGVTAPAGFRASGVACGIKANGKPDMSLLVSDSPAAAAAVFTTNMAQAAPILVSREHLQRAGGTQRPWSSTAAAPTPAPARMASATPVR